MSKSIFSFVGLCVLAMAYPANRAIAGSTEESDRQFLSNLENGTTTQAAPTPATPATKPQPAPQEPTPKTAAVVKKTPEKAPKRVATEHLQQLPAVAEGDLQMTAPLTVTKITVVKTTDVDADPDHDRHHHFFHRLFSHLLSNHPEDW